MHQPSVVARVRLRVNGVPELHMIRVGIVVGVHERVEGVGRRTGVEGTSIEGMSNA